MIGHYHMVGMVAIQRPPQAITMNGQSPPRFIVLLKCDECKALVDEIDQLNHADNHMKDRGIA